MLSAAKHPGIGFPPGGREMRGFFAPLRMTALREAGVGRFIQV
jgi:hypothetical protein